jgi:hypothetical protein
MVRPKTTSLERLCNCQSVWHHCGSDARTDNVNLESSELQMQTRNAYWALRYETPKNFQTRERTIKKRLNQEKHITMKVWIHSAHSNSGLSELKFHLESVRALSINCSCMNEHASRRGS